MSDVIRLGGSTASDVIRLGGKVKKKWATIKEQRERAKKLPLPLRVLASPKTTAVLGVTLASLLYPAAALKLVKGVGKVIMPKTLKGVAIAGITLPTAYGVLKSSPKAWAFTKKALDPREAVKRGEYIAGIIEDPKQIQAIGEKEGWWATVKEAAKKGGKYGVVAAGIVGAAVLGKKYLESRKEKQIREVGIVKKDMPVPTQPAYLSPAFAGYPQISPIQPSGELKRVPPIQNIIQIQVQ